MVLWRIVLGRTVPHNRGRIKLAYPP
jgi:hypothetical protein